MFPAGFRLIEVEETTSTNTACLEAARAGDPGRLWIRAERQSAARGSRGRAWVCEPGNLFASLLLTNPGPVPSLSNLTFVAAIAVRQACRQLADIHGVRPDIALKWPNDVLVNGAKVSGILLEYHSVGGRDAVIIGIGVNCVAHPDATTHRAGNLAAEGMAVTPRDLLELIAGALAEGIDRWDRGANFNDIRREWLEHASGRGQPIVAKLPTREISGIFEDIDGQGQLVLRLNDGRKETVSTADVFFDNAVTKEA